MYFAQLLGLSFWCILLHFWSICFYQTVGCYLAGRICIFSQILRKHLTTSFCFKKPFWSLSQAPEFFLYPWCWFIMYGNIQQCLLISSIQNDFVNLFHSLFAIFRNLFITSFLLNVMGAKKSYHFHFIVAESNSKAILKTMLLMCLTKEF